MTQVYTTKEAAALLKLSPGTLRNWLSKRRISCHRVGDTVRFTDSDIQNIIDGKKPEPSTTAKTKKERKPGKLRAGSDPRKRATMQRACAAFPEVKHGDN